MGGRGGSAPSLNVLESVAEGAQCQSPALLAIMDRQSGLEGSLCHRHRHLLGDLVRAPPCMTKSGRSENEEREEERKKTVERHDAEFATRFCFLKRASTLKGMSAVVMGISLALPPPLHEHSLELAPLQELRNQKTLLYLVKKESTISWSVEEFCQQMAIDREH